MTDSESPRRRGDAGPGGWRNIRQTSQVDAAEGRAVVGRSIVSNRMSLDRAEFIKRCFIALAVALLPLLVWYLFDVVLIAVGALLLAELLGLGAEPLIRWLRVPPRIALALSGLVIFAGFAAAAYTFGSSMAGQIQDVMQRAASGQGNIIKTIQDSALGKFVLQHIHNGIDIAGLVPQAFTLSAGVIGGVVVAVVAGIFFAAQPEVYVNGLVQLFPPSMHSRAEDTVRRLGGALRLWLLGQLIQMLLIGILSTIAVLLIGLPSGWALGLIAGIAEFVPFVGPIISAIPAILVAATQDTHAVVWTVVAYTLIHQVEGHLVVPFIQRYLFVIPPAVTLLGIIAIGSLFGLMAIPLASPLAVVAFVMIKKLYVRDTLGEPTAVPGDSGRRKPTR